LLHPLDLFVQGSLDVEHNRIDQFLISNLLQRLKRAAVFALERTHGTGWNPGEYGLVVKNRLNRMENWQKQMEEWRDSEIDLSRGQEYASYIFNATIGDGTLFEFNVNVRNFGLIDNLPEGACVEVPVLASKRGLSPIHVGKLPDQLAVLVNISARCEELAVEGALTGDPRKIFHAIAFDPLTSAVLSLEEIKNMVDEMFEANRGWLPMFEAYKK
jgi:alpha-galactosidase